VLVVLDLEFFPAFAGAQTVWMWVDDTAAESSGWQVRGSWTAP
jgi:hypothetical protein